MDRFILTFCAVCIPCFFANASNLDRLIAPEIKNDAFYQAIYQLARNEPIQTILEIGSSSGEGSTEAFVFGLQENPHHPTLFCVEMSEPRFAALKSRYAHEPSVLCYNVSSVSLEAFPGEEEVIFFYQNIPTCLNGHPLSGVLDWLRQDIDYLKSHPVPQNGIEQIKQENGIEHFDMVLIDGSEFTGKAELALVYGAKFILLDDINTFKNHDNYHKLLEDPHYELLQENFDLRVGFAIFKLRP